MSYDYRSQLCIASLHYIGLLPYIITLCYTNDHWSRSPRLHSYAVLLYPFELHVQYDITLA